MNNFKKMKKIMGGGKLAVVATALFAAMAGESSFAATGHNLVENGTFDSGNLAPWVRNTTKGSKGKQGTVAIQTSGSSWVDSALASVWGSHVVSIQSYFFHAGNNADTYGNSTDSYIIQSFTVEDVGTYLVSLDCAGRKGNASNWEGAESYVRLYKGTDISATPVFEGGFTPLSNTSYTHYCAKTRITEPGIYTIQILRPEPTGEGNIDKTVVVDNIVFARDNADSLIFNGGFDSGTLNVGDTATTMNGHKDASNEIGFQTGDLKAGFNNPCWSSSGICGLTKIGGSWAPDDPLVGRNTIYMQTYNYEAQHGGSSDSCLWQTFAVPTGGTYRLAFDYSGRNSGNLYGATMYVRLYKGADRTATPVYESSVTPDFKDKFKRFSATVAIADADAGDCTIEFFQQQPETAVSGNSNDMGIIIDNVEFVDIGRNLIQNGDFDDDTNGAGWSVTGNAVRYQTRGDTWVNKNLAVGKKTLTIQTYNYKNNYGDSGDKSVWQAFDVAEPGTYRLSFDYAGRYHSGGKRLFGAETRVRVYAGEGLGGTVLFEGDFMAVTERSLANYVNYMSFDSAGRYTLEFFQSRPATSGGDETDKTVLIDNVSLMSASTVKTVRWTGAVDNDVAKGGNWSGGEVPDADTLALFAGEFAAQIPSGTTFSCAGVVFAENARLAAVQGDWSGLKGVELCGALDLAGHRLILSSLSGSAAISSSVAGGVLEIATAAANDLAVNAGVVINGENVRVEKTGAGTFIAKVPQNYSGGTVVKGGTARPLAATVDIDDGFKAFGAGRISVETGATFDGCGHYGYGNVCDLAGGTLTSSIQMTDYTRSDAATGTVQSSSLMYLNNNMVWGGSGGVTDLRGNTLQISIGGSGNLWLCNSSITNGTIDIVSGGYLCTTSAVDAATVDLRVNCALTLMADIGCRDYVALFPYAQDNSGDGALKVYGTFTPPAEHNYFYGCTMQDGAMIDLSGQSGTWNLKSACTKGKTVVDFADDATIYVKLGNRSLASSSPVIAWTEESCPANLSSLAFKCGDADRKYGLLKKSDGIYVVSGLTITFY